MKCFFKVTGFKERHGQRDGVKTEGQNLEVCPPPFLVGELEKKIRRMVNLCSSSLWRQARRLAAISEKEDLL